MDRLDNVDGNLQTIEEDDKIAPNEAVERIAALFKEASIAGLSDWKQNIIEKEQSIFESRKEAGRKWCVYFVVESQLNGLKNDYDNLNEDYQKFSSKYPDRLKEYDGTINSSATGNRFTHGTVKQNIRAKRNLNVAIEELKTKLAGTISAPNARMNFFFQIRILTWRKLKKHW